MHPLDGAYERVRRASKHLSYLKRRVNNLRQIVAEKVSTDEYSQSLLQDRPQNISHISQALAISRFMPEREELIIGIFVGEIIYNLRCALDYLIYELAHLDSGNVVEGTQFPIDDCKKVFAERRNGFLKGIKNEHIAYIKTLQPCEGCEWTKIIAKLSNADKHRHLSISFPSIWFTVSHNRTESPMIQDTMHVENNPPIQVQFTDGKEVTGTIETLYELKAQVTKTLGFFKPKFK